MTLPWLQLTFHFYRVWHVTCDHHEEMSISSAVVRRRDKAKILFRIAILGRNLAPKAPKILCHRLHKAVWPMTNGPTLHFGRPCDLWPKSWSKWYSITNSRTTENHVFMSWLGRLCVLLTILFLKATRATFSELKWPTSPPVPQPNKCTWFKGKGATVLSIIYIVCELVGTVDMRHRQLYY